MTQQRADYPLDYSKGPKEGAEDRVRDFADKAQDMATDAAEQARIYAEKAQEAAKNFKPFVEKSMKEQPMSTLAAAAVIGFALGALWKR
jgi:ElaB/YqjD/DUF883 family membrane-anchored ribosome-binding protein